MKKKELFGFAMLMLMLAAVVMLQASDAHAFTATTGVGSDLYDLVVTKFIKGPIGTAAGVALVVLGGVGAAMGQLSRAAWPLVGGGVLVAAPTLATSLGMII